MSEETLRKEINLLTLELNNAKEEIAFLKYALDNIHDYMNSKHLSIEDVYKILDSLPCLEDYPNDTTFNNMKTQWEKIKHCRFEEHSGDCTKQPWTCKRCIVEFYYGENTDPRNKEHL